MQIDLFGVMHAVLSLFHNIDFGDAHRQIIYPADFNLSDMTDETGAQTLPGNHRIFCPK